MTPILPDRVAKVRYSRLMTALREKRRELYTRDNVKAFMVASNRTLELLEELVPKTPEELVQLPGWTQERVDRYGVHFLEVINGSKNV